MYVELPDPHPGRCKNFRNNIYMGQIEHLRCLEYENERHVCRFQEPKQIVAPTDYSLSWSKAHQDDIKPWVKPEDGTSI